MSASLVGSEMCIRDRVRWSTPGRGPASVHTACRVGPGLAAAASSSRLATSLRGPCWHLPEGRSATHGSPGP
eukprot:14230797-Alexandrium_andersonii.AAC.1